MGIKVTIAVALGKLAKITSRVLKHGGTSIPGLVALKIDNHIIGDLSSGMMIHVICGTNGKTTTNRMILEGLKSQYDNDAVSNGSGSNLRQGIATLLVDNARMSGKPRKRYATIEVDEATMAKVCGELRPYAVTVTNVFRDQLDRYGELDLTSKMIETGIRLGAPSIVCLNADDPNVSCIGYRIAEDADGFWLRSDYPKPRILWYGMERAVYDKKTDDALQEVARCPRCGSDYVYDDVLYGSIGKYRCEKCGLMRPTPNVSITKISEGDNGKTSISVDVRATGDIVSADIDGSRSEVKHYDVSAGEASGFNIVNCLAAFSSLYAMNCGMQAIRSAIGGYRPPFGRNEVARVNGCDMHIVLAKNPTGMNQAINMILNCGSASIVAVLLGDDACDGRDISWIYDASFEGLSKVVESVICGGRRRYDMSVRMRYAGIESHVEDTYDDVIKRACNNDNDNDDSDDVAMISTVFVIANYSEMMKFRKHIADVGIVGSFWEDEDADGA